MDKEMTGTFTTTGMTTTIAGMKRTTSPQKKEMKRLGISTGILKTGSKR